MSKFKISTVLETRSFLTTQRDDFATAKFLKNEY